MKTLLLGALSLTALTTVGCDGSREPTESGDSTATKATVLERTEAALLDQIKCEEPPQAGVAMSAMLRNGFIRKNQQGSDSVTYFDPIRPMKLLGFEIVEFGGFQPHDELGAMPPFDRVPGTAPHDFIEITVRASSAEVKRELEKLGVEYGRYVPDPDARPVSTSEGDSTQPEIWIPGTSVSEGNGYTTVECRGTEYEFERRDDLRASKKQPKSSA